ncbi:MAG: hypothetical protein EP343_03850 [Deltaproteobacteria bacterium]|nr:MAG: hypothetical protein EP343_03850 [Deltaproteobacteria bacterium]
MRWINVLAIVGLSGLVVWMLPPLQAESPPSKKVEARAKARTTPSVARKTQAPKLRNVRRPKTARPIPVIRLVPTQGRKGAPNKRGATPNKKGAKQRRIIDCSMILLISGMT